MVCPFQTRAVLSHAPSLATGRIPRAALFLACVAMPPMVLKLLGRIPAQWRATGSKHCRVRALWLGCLAVAGAFRSTGRFAAQDASNPAGSAHAVGASRRPGSHSGDRRRGCESVRAGGVPARGRPVSRPPCGQRIPRAGRDGLDQAETRHAPLVARGCDGRDRGPRGPPRAL